MRLPASFPLRLGISFTALAFVILSCAKKEVKQETLATTVERESSSVGSPSQEAEKPLKTVYFDFDSYRLTQDGKALLNENIRWLKENPTVAVRVEGHCDERGSKRYNYDLGKRRAAAVRDFLLKGGIKRSRISVVSHGEDYPADPASHEEAWAKNRRCETVPASRYAQAPNDP